MKTHINYHDRSYDVRLQAVEELGKRFPGPISALGFKHRELGMWAGIFMQTLWQADSGRDRLSIWYLINQSLTLAPLAFYKEYRGNPDTFHTESSYVRQNPTRDTHLAPLTQTDVAKAWKEVFKTHDYTRSLIQSKNILKRLKGHGIRITLQRKLWKAHTTSMRHAIWQNLPLLRHADIPEEELKFWRGWVRFILFNEKVSPPTTDFFLKPFLDAAMPPHSPLDSSSQIRHPLLRRFLLGLLTLRLGSLENFYISFEKKKQPKFFLKWRSSIASI